MQKKFFPKESKLSGKQLSVYKKKPRPVRKGIVVFLAVYFILSDFFILYTIQSWLYSRFDLTYNEVAVYNFLNKRTAVYKLEEFSDFEIGLHVNSGRHRNTTNLYIKVNGPIKVSFLNRHRTDDVLLLMKKLKENYTVNVNRKYYRQFMNRVNKRWTAERKNILEEIFEEK